MAFDMLGREAPQSPSSFEKSAARLLLHIEMRVKYMKNEARKADEAYFWRDTPPSHHKHEGKDHIDSSTPPLSLASLEQYSYFWKGLIPHDPALKSALIHLIADRYDLNEADSPQLLQALGYADVKVRDAYRAAYGQPIETVFAVRRGVHDLSQAVSRNLSDVKPGEDNRGSISAAIEQSEEDARAAATNMVANVEASALSDTVDEKALQDIDARMQWLHLPGGETLYKQGDPAESLYILVSGRLRKVILRENGSEEVISELCRGEMVGEVGVLTGASRTTTVYAIRDSELLTLQRDDLTRLAEKHPGLVLHLTRLLANRLRVQTEGSYRKANTLATFTIIPVHRRRNSHKNFADFVQGFAESMSEHGSVLYLSSQQIDSIFGEGTAQADINDPDYEWLSAWLNEQESIYRYILYVADDTLTPWTRRCIRQADRILIVSHAQANPEPGEIEKEMGSMTVKACKELVLLHPEYTVHPSGTHRWLAPGRFEGHYHVRMGSAAHLRRMARRLTGNALGLVLSGGGARGLAHIGVIRALHEAGLEIDLVGGTSMGAFIGALYAMGKDEQDMAQMARDLSSPFTMYDLTLPLVSFLKSEKITNIMKNAYEDTRIEDLWVPFFCVSTNLTKALPMVHKQGILWEATRASGAIPGVFSPMLLDGELLVDGAVLNNLPVDVMHNFSEGGPVIAVNVMPEVDLVKQYNFGPSVSGWQVLLNKLNPFSEDFEAPLIFENILRVISLNDVHQARAKLDLADLYIRPEVESYSILNFRPHKKLTAIGYQQARQDIANWLEARQGEAQPTPVTHDLNSVLDELDKVLSGNPAS